MRQRAGCTRKSLGDRTHIDRGGALTGKLPSNQHLGMDAQGEVEHGLAQIDPDRLRLLHRVILRLAFCQP